MAAKVKVQMLGSSVSTQPGDVVEVDKTTAAALILNGLAVGVSPAAKAITEDES